MRVMLFGATGMVGQGALRECLLDPGVERVLIVVRKATEQRHPKLDQLVQEDFLDFSSVEGRLAGYDACFFCLGVASAGMTEQAYTRVTYDITLAAAQVLVRRNPGMTFIFVSGAGTNSAGRAMWARVKGRTENVLLGMPFKAVYVFRPGFIQPLHGITSRTKLYRAFYTVFGPLFPVIRLLFPHYVTTTEQIGRAMLRAAKQGAPTTVLESRDITALGTPSSR